MCAGVGASARVGVDLHVRVGGGVWFVGCDGWWGAWRPACGAYCVVCPVPCVVRGASLVCGVRGGVCPVWCVVHAVCVGVCVLCVVCAVCFMCCVLYVLLAVCVVHDACCVCCVLLKFII